MAREESSREDLLREATALVERVELRVTGSETTPRDGHERVVIGFRANGSTSFFFGEDPVYQFNSAGELRRAYCGGLLFKAAHGRLISLQRIRQQNEVQLLSRQLTDDEQKAFAAEMGSRLRDLTNALQNDSYDVIGQMPTETDVVNRVRNWLARYDVMLVAATPRAL
jgi:hypothetical protein